MTRRIALPIEGATETRCYDDKRTCPLMLAGECAAFGAFGAVAGERLPSCTQAEASHAALVRDARLGATMRKVNVSLVEATERLRRLRSDIGSLQLSYPGGGHSLRFELALMEAYVAALRSEAER
jgi:hypothetical protein